MVFAIVRFAIPFFGLLLFGVFISANSCVARQNNMSPSLQKIPCFTLTTASKTRLRSPAASVA